MRTDLLAQTIQIWEEVLNGAPEPWLDPLCNYYISSSCIGCPINNAGHPNCDPSPYMEWREHYHAVHVQGDVLNETVGPMKIRCPECEASVRKWIQLLKGIQNGRSFARLD